MPSAPTSLAGRGFFVSFRIYMIRCTFAVDMKESQYIMFPEFWDELTEKDWADMLRLRQRLIDNPPKGVTAVDVRREAARQLLLNRGLRTRSSDRKYLILVEQAARRLDWLWEATDQEGTLQLTWRSTNQLLPKFGNLIGPMSHGQDLLFGEFKDALTLLTAYEKSHAAADTLLAQLCGLLWRPRDKKVKTRLQRTPYDADGADERQQRGIRLPEWFRWGAYAWFAFFCEYLATGIFIIDGQEVTFAPVFRQTDAATDDGSPAGSSLGLNAIALTLASDRVFGSYADVHRTPLMQVMLKLLHDHQELQRLKAQYNGKP